MLLQRNYCGSFLEDIVFARHLYHLYFANESPSTPDAWELVTQHMQVSVEDLLSAYVQTAEIRR